MAFSLLCLLRGGRKTGGAGGRCSPSCRPFPLHPPAPPGAGVLPGAGRAPPTPPFPGEPPPSRGASGAPAVGGGGVQGQGRAGTAGAVPLPASRGRAGPGRARWIPRGSSPPHAFLGFPPRPLFLPKVCGIQESPGTAAPAAAPFPAGGGQGRGGTGRGGEGRGGCPRGGGALPAPRLGVQVLHTSRPAAASGEELEGNNRKRGGEQQLQKH